ncbi:MetQ/NlpA family ABC transporter substrate-binding protein [Bifidobacterium aerophilum]|uniref:MetQ/NlpA family ABC transporter substrate-binding protein n=1 Tax=Bifidobacterium aerophilum TaxID=1798155 RepID=A0A6N9Z1P8_9BIFI|nr:MetQ/NlpA family ABC transporter substrate-binding protein [Bifidobacterium aerophilum]NEG88472.1 MetQ/NlpA family ABC transporter substrate-binding protein [Bifidobacterium aerophilum]
MNTRFTRTGIGKALRAGLAIVSALGMLVTAAACGSTDANGVTTLKVALTTSTDDPLWDQVNKNLEKEGAKVRVKTVPMKSAVLGNQALSAGDVDLSAQQHYAFLNGEIKEKGYKFTVIGEAYISPLNIYSENIKDVSELKDGDKILIPNDVTNGGRALIVLQEAGVLKIDPKKNDPANGVYPAEEDITSNPKNIELVPTDRNMIMSSLKDAAAGIANANAVVDYGKSPEKDSIFKINPDPSKAINKPWINVIVARTEDKDKDIYKEVIKAYHQDNVRELMENESKGAEIPTW